MPLPSVMFVTPSKPLSQLAQGLFKRCGLLVLERRTFEDADRTLDELWSPDCLVLDVHALNADERRAAIATLCALVRKHLTQREPESHVVVATGAQLEGVEAERCEEMNIHVIKTKGPRYRRVARELLDLVGLDGAACCPADSERRVAPEKELQYRPPPGPRRRA